MLKGLTLTPPIVGRISIGKVVERGGKRLPDKDDEFTLISQVQIQGIWMPHPLNDLLRQALANTGARDHPPKLRNIPVRLVFDDPDLNLRAAYTLFDRSTSRPLCVGDGEQCKRATPQGVQRFACPGPEYCVIAEGRCKPFGRLNVRVDTDGMTPAPEHDELGTFVFRTTGFNSIRTLATRLRYFDAVSGGKLSTLPLTLRLRGKSTTQSHRTPIYYVDLTVRGGESLVETIRQARAAWDSRRTHGFDQTALDATARQSLALGAFEESAEEAGAIQEEFYPEPEVDEGPLPPCKPTTTGVAPPPRLLRTRDHVIRAENGKGLAHKLATKCHDANMNTSSQVKEALPKSEPADNRMAPAPTHAPREWTVNANGSDSPYSYKP